MNVKFRFMDGTRDWGWINNHVGILRCEDTGGLVAVNADTGETIAACVWDNITANSVQCHLVIENALAVRHGFINNIADLIFNGWQKKAIYGLVPANNAKAIKMNKHIGFTIKTRLEDAYAEGVDYLVMELKKENCPYFKNKSAAA